LNELGSGAQALKGDEHFLNIECIDNGEKKRSGLVSDIMEIVKSRWSALTESDSLREAILAKRPSEARRVENFRHSLAFVVDVEEATNRNPI